MRFDGLDYEFDFHSATFLVRGQPVKLTSQQTLALQALVSSFPGVVRRDELRGFAFMRSQDPSDYAIDKLMSTLRRKFPEGWIETVKGVGHRWQRAVIAVADESPNSTSSDPQQTQNLVGSYGQFITYFQEKLQTNNEIIVSFMPGTWAINLLASICLFRSRGGRLLVNVDRTEGFGRFLLLRALGCSVVETASAPKHSFVGLVCNGSRGDGEILSYSNELLSRSGRFHSYRSIDDPVVVRVCHSAGASGHRLEGPQPSLVIEEFDRGEICRLISGAEYYKGREVDLEEVPIDELVPIQPKVARYKLNQARQIIHHFEGTRRKAFVPVAAKLADNLRSPLVPPVAERGLDGRLRLVDGHSRVMAVRKHTSLKEIVCAVVRGVSEPLPGGDLDWERVGVDDGEQELFARPAPHARRIDRAVHAELMERLKEGSHV